MSTTPSPPHRDPSGCLPQAERIDSLTTLATGLAHDLGNLLTAIRGNAEILLRQLPSTAPERKNALLIESITSHAVRMAEQLRTYSGRSAVELQGHDLCALVRDAADLLTASVPAGAHLTYDLGHPLPYLPLDAAQVRQLLIHLVTNAVEAYPERAGAVWVSTVLEDCSAVELERTFSDAPLAAGLYAVVEVRDQGCGIAPEIQPRIFDPYFTTKLRAQGMGLSICLGIMRAHRGGITVDTTPGQGSTLRALFPCPTGLTAPR